MTESSRRSYKIIFTGPAGAGKSTAINTISDTPIVTTQEFSTNETSVAMDYGMLKIPGGDVVHLYSTPGQERFNYQWENLNEGGLGLVLLINNANPQPLDELDFFIATFADLISTRALAIGITHMDQSDQLTIDQYHQHLASRNMTFPLFEVDARVKRDVQILVQALLYCLV